MTSIVLIVRLIALWLAAVGPLLHQEVQAKALPQGSKSLWTEVFRQLFLGSQSNRAFFTDLAHVSILCWTPENGAEKYVSFKFDDPDIKEKLLNFKFDPKRPTKVIANGFQSDPMSHYPPYVKAYFSVASRPVNILAVSWRKLSIVNYFNAASNSIKVGQSLGELFAQLLIKDMDVDPANIHGIGHSLGAHMLGHMARGIESLGNKGKIGRITALDPAGPQFKDDTTKRVRVGDADFLDVIHTNSGSFWKGGLSLIDPIGDVDFYPNGGKRQPGCSTVTDITTFCSHRRSYKFYTESIGYVGQKNKFSARACGSYDNFLKNNCPQVYLNMGEGLTKASAKEAGENKLFYLKTNKEAPYSE